ncbi:hypothetical protein AB0E83_30065 [Streptomyces sp. NPDC035033]|uniref:hypothetical protein n=1 Tax=Streptomyces sp. NPDC035033 TaxID=3155368 RepID=UPI0033CE70C3
MISPIAYASPYPTRTAWRAAGPAPRSCRVAGATAFTMKKSRVVMNTAASSTGRANRRPRPAVRAAASVPAWGAVAMAVSGRAAGGMRVS